MTKLPAVDLTPYLMNARQAALELAETQASVERTLRAPANTFTSITAVIGEVIERNPDALPQAMIECTTEFDYAELPDDLQADLKDWCERFTRWAADH